MTFHKDDLKNNYRKAFKYYINRSSMNFQVPKEDLIQIVSLCQQRSYSEEVDFLQGKGEDIGWLVKGILSDTKIGIQNEQNLLQQRKQFYGSNQKTINEPPGLLQLFCQALQDFTLRILIVSAILSIAIQTATAQPQKRGSAWVQGFAILVAVFVCATVTSVNDYQKERQFLKLNSVADQKKKVTVKRNGILMELHQDFVLVGDLIQINQGMEIPADGILVQSNQITTDESAMTGQTEPIKKNILQYCIKKKEELQKNGEKNISNKHEVPTPIMMSGTKILTGEGKMLVLVVGSQSCMGKIRALLEKDEAEATPLQQKLQVLANDIGKFGLYSAIGIIVVLLIRLAIQKGTQRSWDTGKDLAQILNFFIIGITVVVVAIPQGLPLSVTLSLAFSVKKMLNDQNLVRKMEACETMGGANNICSDKTGTLTMNKMTLSQIWNQQARIIDTYKQKLQESELGQDKKYIELMKIASLVNSTALLEPEEKGSSTQIAILKYFQKMNIGYDDYRKKYETKCKYPFSSARKRMSVIVTYQNQAHLFIKGASQIVLGSANKWHNAKTGQIQPISTQLLTQLEKNITKMAEQSLRTLCLGYKKLSAHDDLQVKDQKGVFTLQKQNIVLLAIFGVRDIPRKQVPDAIKQCHLAGITVRMVTGDNIITAKAIAKDIGILKEGGDFIAMEGPDFHKLVGGVVCTKCRVAVCDCPLDAKKAEEEGLQARIDTVANAEQFDKIKDKLLVLARSRPEDKYCLVTGLKERGNVVAVTGDGTNDAPALKKADVGFAMGITGTQVAREAAAIILIDDNFNSIVKAVIWGRNIYDCIRKFIQFQLTVNVAAVVLTLVGAALIKQQILKPIQMLWINLIMDTLASLALATEQPNESLLLRPPHSRHDYIISKTMFKHIAGQAIFQLTVVLVILFSGQKWIPEEVDDLDYTTFKDNPGAKWYNGVVGGTVRSGRLYTIAGKDDYQPIYSDYYINSRHFTFLFNTFVMMTLFNFINARKIRQQFNILHDISKNIFFIGVVVLILVMQLILISFTGHGFGIYPQYGLTPKQWLLTIAIGSIGIVVNFILKLLPFCKVQQHQSDEPGQRIQTEKGTKIGKRKSVLNLKRIQERVQRDLAKNNPFH